MLRLSGLEREVYLYARPKVHIQDIAVNAGLDNQYQDGQLDLSVKIKNGSASAKNKLSLHISLLDDQNDFQTLHQEEKFISLKSNDFHQIRINTAIPNPGKWTAETPRLYTVLVQLKDQNGQTIEVTTVKNRLSPDRDQRRPTSCQWPGSIHPWSRSP